MHEPIFEYISANLKLLSIDEIKQRLAPVVKGMVVASPIFDTGTYLYRARKIDNEFNKAAGINYADLIYPPKHKAKLGRLNRDNESVFYCSMGKEAPFFELQDLQPGCELVLTFWRTTEVMYVNNIGYTKPIFDQLGASRPCPQWFVVNQSGTTARAVISLPDASQERLETAIAGDANRDLRHAFSKHFMHKVKGIETEKYKLTTAIGELHLGSINGGAQHFGGVLYPSVRMFANSDNLALLPWFVDRHLSFRKAVHIRIDRIDGTKFSITTLDCAKTFDQDRRLSWLGRVTCWTLQPGQTAKFIGTAGPDGDGDYETGSDGKVCHWVAVDALTGGAIEAA